jgi:folate-dependent phosphoribosylglycinamide formyltransferase PurN
VKADKRNVATIVMKKAAPNHRTRTLDDDMVRAVYHHQTDALTTVVHVDGYRRLHYVRIVDNYYNLVMKAKNQYANLKIYLRTFHFSPFS